MTHEQRAKVILSSALGPKHPRVQQSAHWISQFTTGAVDVAVCDSSYQLCITLHPYDMCWTHVLSPPNLSNSQQTGKSTLPDRMAKLSPLTWISLRSTPSSKVKLTINNLLQLFEASQKNGQSVKNLVNMLENPARNGVNGTTSPDGNTDSILEAGADRESPEDQITDGGKPKKKYAADINAAILVFENCPPPPPPSPYLDMTTCIM